MKRALSTLSLLSLVLLLTPAYFAQAALSDKADLSDKITGRILLQVEDKGQAYYVDPVTRERAYLGRPSDAFRVMRELGLGISNANLAKIAEPGEKDTDVKLAKSLAGRIVLRVEDKGQAYYINPVDLKKYYLGKPADAFAVMRSQGLGITNDDLDKVPVFQKYKERVEQLENKMEQIESAGRVLGKEVKKQDEVIVKQREQIEDLKRRVEKLNKNQESAQSSLPSATDSPDAIINLPTPPSIQSPAMSETSPVVSPPPAQTPTATPTISEPVIRIQPKKWEINIKPIIYNEPVKTSLINGLLPIFDSDISPLTDINISVELIDISDPVLLNKFGLLGLYLRDKENPSQRIKFNQNNNVLTSYRDKHLYAANKIILGGLPINKELPTYTLKISFNETKNSKEWVCSNFYDGGCKFPKFPIMNTITVVPE